MDNFEKLSHAIDEQKDLCIELEKLLTKNVAISPESGGKGELAKCLILEDFLKKHGFCNFERFDAPDENAEGGIRPNLLVTVNGKSSSKRIWVIAHLDVVPSGELSLWNTNPFEVVEKDGKLYGRGVEDNQQGLCSAVLAAKAFIDSSIVPEYEIKLLFVADEECGSKYGMVYLLKNYNLFRKDDLIVIPDGGDRDGYTIEVAEKNLLWLKVRTIGKQAHGSRPDEGANAHLANCELALFIHSLEEKLSTRDNLFEPNYSTFQPTKKENNVPNVNTIPGEDVIYFDCRILPCYSLDFVRKEIAKKVSAVEQRYNVKIELTEEQAVESVATDKNCDAVKLLSKGIKAVYNLEAKTIGIGGGTVAAELRNNGFDAVVWSKLFDTAHQPNEFCVVENLLDDAKVLAFVMNS